MLKVSFICWYTFVFIDAERPYCHSLFLTFWHDFILTFKFKALLNVMFLGYITTSALGTRGVATVWDVFCFLLI